MFLTIQNYDPDYEEFVKNHDKIYFFEGFFCGKPILKHEPSPGTD